MVLFNRKNKSGKESRIETEIEYSIYEDCSYPVYNKNNLDAVCLSNVTKLQRLGLTSSDFDTAVNNLGEIADYILYVQKNIKHRNNVDVEKVYRVAFAMYSDFLVYLMEDKAFREMAEGVKAEKHSKFKEKPKPVSRVHSFNTANEYNIFEKYLHRYEMMRRTF